MTLPRSRSCEAGRTSTPRTWTGSDATGWAPPASGLWETLVTGFYPYIHDRQVDAGDWLADYFRTYVERDLREVERVSDLPTFENFVRLAAARTGQELNLSALADDVGVTQQTIRRWLNALEVGFLVTMLPPPSLPDSRAAPLHSP